MVFRWFLVVISVVSFVAPGFAVPLKDNVLFAFEKCKALTVDLEKGQLTEAYTESFDLHCSKSTGELEFSCIRFDSKSNQRLGEETFKGGSELGKAQLLGRDGRRITFLIGKGFAAFEAPAEHKACVGIYLFEQDALKKKASVQK